VLALEADYGWFGQMALGQWLPPGAVAEVVAADGRVQARHPAPLLRGMGQAPTEEAAARMARVLGGERVHEELDPDGVRRICAYTLLSDQPGRELFVRVGVPMSEALSPARSSARRSYVGLALAGLLGLVGAALFARRSIVAPAHDILEATRRLAEGELSHRINRRGSDELALLAQGVDSMAASLEASTEALREAGRKERLILENSVAGYFVTTAAGRFVEANAALARMFGYESFDHMRSEIGDIGGQIYARPAEREALLATLAEKGQVSGMEVEGVRRDGSSFWTTIAALAQRDEAGRIVGIQGFAAEITERKRAELNLAEANERFLRVLDSQHDPLFVADAETDIILYANRAALERVGMDLVGRPCWAAMHGGRCQVRPMSRQALLGEDGRPAGVCLARDARARHRGLEPGACAGHALGGRPHGAPGNLRGHHRDQTRPGGSARHQRAFARHSGQHAPAHRHPRQGWPFSGGQPPHGRVGHPARGGARPHRGGNVSP
jgi:PAS domain S-box-containing protein